MIISDNCTEAEILNDMYIEDYFCSTFDDTELDNRPVKLQKHFSKKLRHPRLTSEQRFEKKQNTLRAANGNYYIWKWQPIKNTTRKRRVYMAPRAMQSGYWWSTHIEDACFFFQKATATNYALLIQAEVEQLVCKDRVVVQYR